RLRGARVELDRPAVSAPAFWEEIYARGGDGWELGTPAPPLAAWLEAGGGFTAVDGAGPARVAVPGSGRGHDARLLARRGYRVWGFDFASAAIADARALAENEGVEVSYEERDIFTLARDRAGFFDAVWEYTCFCAIDPRGRDEPRPAAPDHQDRHPLRSLRALLRRRLAELLARGQDDDRLHQREGRRARQVQDRPGGRRQPVQGRRGDQRGRAAAQRREG